ncbi:sugar phosphate isomerase/epimerase family protein [Clostridium rectalis]|uniref:sugar phosphate isomerase/epimerase family protein n=1 Tax=Clostridium rectalis TaxID=2040295 RepID=UPI001FAA3B15|nr:sugar phosphate isomerase/epimerase family protein [Clostridium rectalis]
MIKKIGYAASIGENNIYETIDFAKKNGMNAVELNLNVPIYFPENFTKLQREDIKNYAYKNGINITMHAPEDISLLQLHDTLRNAGIKRLKEVIDFGIEIGATRMTMHIGSAVCFTLVTRKSYMDEFYYNNYYSILKNTLKDLVNYAQDKIMICVENSGRFPKKLVQEILNDLIKEENLYLTWDIGHSYLNKYNEVEFFIKNIDRIKTCHIHDNNGVSDHQIPGTGNIDFKKYFNLLANKDIIYIIEVRPRENAVESLKKLKEFKFL